MSTEFRYFIVNKPYGMLSQFTAEGEHRTLADLNADIPTDVYSVGRLDADSEGLLLLTNDNGLKSQLLHPKYNKSKEYWVQIDDEINDNAIAELEKGVQITITGQRYDTLPAVVKKMDEPDLWERTPPVRKRKFIPTSWISLKIIEGKNRQVRKMTAAVGFPTLRLVRVTIGNLEIGNLQPEAVLEISRNEAYKALER